MIVEALHGTSLGLPNVAPEPVLVSQPILVRSPSSLHTNAKPKANKTNPGTRKRKQPKTLLVLNRAPRAPLAASAAWAHGGNVRLYSLHNVGAHLRDDG